MSLGQKEGMVVCCHDGRWLVGEGGPTGCNRVLAAVIGDPGRDSGADGVGAYAKAASGEWRPRRRGGDRGLSHRGSLPPVSSYFLVLFLCYLSLPLPISIFVYAVALMVILMVLVINPTLMVCGKGGRWVICVDHWFSSNMASCTKQRKRKTGERGLRNQSEALMHSQGRKKTEYQDEA